MFAPSVRQDNSPTTDSAMSTAQLDQSPVSTPPLVLPAMLPAEPALSTQASAPVALLAADRSSTSSALPAAQLEPSQSTEPANTAHTAVLPALDQTPPAHHAHQERSSTMELAMTSAPSS